ncbi:hypothetical protein MUO56_02055 [Candidatus Bathyarchaeota archaeon]|nr:hypothetical protein [Candidatus Bathyarchaeota archaeon]
MSKRATNPTLLNRVSDQPRLNSAIYCDSQSEPTERHYKRVWERLNSPIDKKEERTRLRKECLSSMLLYTARAPDKMPILKETVKRHLGEGNIDNIEIVGTSLEKVREEFSAAAKSLK